MNSRTDWFRRTSWTPADRAEFTTRLGRSRSSVHKAQYLRIQAIHLAEAEPPLYEAALELLDVMVRDFPEPSQLAAAHQQRAHCIASLGRAAEALEVLRQALEVELSQPGILVNAYLDFAELVLSLGRSEFYAEALQVIEKRMGREMFPIGQYRGCAAAAFLCAELEFHERARTYAVDALAAAARTVSPFRYHQALGVVERTDPDVQARLWRLAGRTPT